LYETHALLLKYFVKNVEAMLLIGHHTPSSLPLTTDYLFRKSAVFLDLTEKLCLSEIWVPHDDDYENVGNIFSCLSLHSLFIWRHYHGSDYIW